MTKFRKGDKVRIQKPTNKTEYPFWTAEMDKWDGKEVTVASPGLYGGDCEYPAVGVLECDFVFSTDWLTLVTPKDNLTFPTHAWAVFENTGTYVATVGCRRVARKWCSLLGGRKYRKVTLMPLEGR